jgi:SAM-dependent methyltransferase
VLTVDYERLGLEPGDRVLDLGAGFGRHAFEAYRRGAVTVAVDVAEPELRSCLDTFGAMAAAGEPLDGAVGTAVRGSALALPFATGSFDRVIASEVLEHVADDGAALAELARVLRPGGALAVTVPAWLGETVCWRLSEDYHAPAVPGGHVRIYRAGVLRARLRAAGLEPVGTGRAHALHTPYWWLRCAVGVGRDDHPAVRAYHRLLVWDITRRPRALRWVERLADPALAKSLVLYARRAAVGGEPAGRVPGAAGGGHDVAA